MNASREQAAAALGRVEGLLDFVRVPAERLLAEDVLARLDGSDRPLAVHGVRQRDVDGVDVRVLEQRLVGAVGALDPHFRAYSSARDCSRLATAISSTLSDAWAPGITSRLMCAVETMPSRINPMTPPSSAVARSRGCGDSAGA